MNTETTKTDSVIASADRLGDASKLFSLLGLAAGVVAIPPAAQADIIYTNLTSNPFHVGFGGQAGASYDLLGLPGGAAFGFRTKNHYDTTLMKSFRTVTARKLGTAPVSVQSKIGFAAPLYKGAPWNALPASLASGIFLGTATDRGHYPSAGYDHMYLAWTFSDTTHAGAKRYGWIELGLVNGNVLGFGGPDVTIYGYAWENTGVKIAMGDTGPVPEPSSAALLALGALALGAKGVRSWRRNRPPFPQGQGASVLARDAQPGDK